MTASTPPLRRRPHHVVMVAYPDVQILDATGPLEVFSRASRWMQDHGIRRDLAYRVEVVAPRAGAFSTSSGVRLVAERSYREVTRSDTLLAAGGLLEGRRATTHWVYLNRKRPLAVGLMHRVHHSGRFISRSSALRCGSPRSDFSSESAFIEERPPSLCL